MIVRQSKIKLMKPWDGGTTMVLRPWGTNTVTKFNVKSVDSGKLVLTYPKYVVPDESVTITLPIEKPEMGTWYDTKIYIREEGDKEYA